MTMSKLRTIKFRGFNKKRGIWLYGNYILNRGAHFIAPQEFANGKTWEDYEVVEESIGQFTGMVDDCDTDIYEGDIVAYGESAFDYEIVYDAPFFCIRECGSGDLRIIDEPADVHVVGKSYNMGQ